MLKTASWMVGNCRFASQARTALVVAHALHTAGINIAPAKVAFLLKVALPQDWNTLSDTDKRVIEIAVQRLVEPHVAKEGAYPSQPTMAQMETFLQALARSRTFRISLDAGTIRRLATYVVGNWKGLLEPSETSLTTILDTMDPPEHRP